MHKFLFSLFNNTLHGSAKWAGFFERTRFINKKNSGFLVDGIRSISEKASFQHLFVLAPSGMGKTTFFVIPNVIRQNFKGSMVILDPKGEIFKNTASSLEEDLGVGSVRVIDPFCVRTKNTDTYNPLHNIKTMAQAKTVAKTLMSQVASDSDPFWHITGASLLSALLFLLHHKNERLFTRLRALLALEFEEIDLLIEDCNDTNLNEEYASFKKADIKLKSSILAMVSSSIEVFGDEHIKNVTSSNTFDFSELRKKETILYIILPEHKTGSYKAFTSLLFSQLFESLIENEGLETRVIIDEFANIGVIPGFAELLATVRSRKISIAIILQTINKLKSVYPKTYEAIFEGCGTKMILGGVSDGKTLEIFSSNLLGNKTIVTDTLSENKSTISRTSRPLLTKDEIRRIPNNQAVLVYTNQQPIFIRQIVPYYAQRELRYFVKFANKMPCSFDKK